MENRKKVEKPKNLKKQKPTTDGVKKLKLLVTVVNRNKAEYYADLIQGYGVNMQTIVPAKGTANAEMLSLLGLAGSQKAVIFSTIREDMAAEVCSVLEEKFRTVKNGKGIAYTLPLSSIIGVLAYGFLSDNRLTVKEN
ncbi:MAG: hypothetical protein E7369_00510 [Clostridiales bacterium]|nr:hypothetical protein [Clostridiales bacterium]